MASTSSSTGDTFEIIFSATAGTAFVYRYRYAGICGPMTASVPAVDRTAAEAEALRYGVVRSGEWSTAANGYDHAPASRITV